MEKNEKTWQPELSGQDLCIDLMFGQRHSTTCFFSEHRRIRNVSAP
jgi:hypothetical protein